jgi:hypothetical protein
MFLKALFGAVVATAVIGTMSLQSHAATFGTYGDAFDNGAGAYDLTSSGSSGVGYSGLYIKPTGLQLGDITQLSADYNMLAGPFTGGSPRFSIADFSNNQVYAYWGTPLGGGSFADPLPNGTPGSTGNFADLSSPDLRFYSNGFGGLNSPSTGLTWSQLVAAVGSVPVWYVFLDLDSGWTGNDQHLLVSNFTLNGDVMPTPLPAALPLFASVLVGAGWLVRRRRKQAA